ncbi:MAG: hypothetical protein WBO04_17080 [Steroidobacteraceae bacterium]
MAFDSRLPRIWRSSLSSTGAVLLLDDFLAQGAQVDGLRLECEPARLPAPEGQHVVEQCRHALHAGLDARVQLLLLGFRQPCRVALQQFGGGEDRGQWRAELVRGHRDETRLELVQPALLLQRGARLFLGLASLADVEVGPDRALRQVGGVERDAADLEPDEAAVLAAHAHVAAVGPAGGELRVGLLAERAPGRLVLELEPARLSDELAGPVTEQFLELAVHPLVAAILVPCAP